jgi:hypothetical protein
MDDEEQYREWVQDYFKEHPEVAFEVTSRVTKALEELGIEPEPELVSHLALNAVVATRADYLALAGEVMTKEDKERIIREEADRLMDPETKLINVSELDQAATRRIKQEIRAFFPHRFGGP